MRKTLLALALFAAILATGCADFAEFADRVKEEVLQPFQTAFKASMFAFFDQQLAAFAPKMQEWLMAELQALFDKKTAEIMAALAVGR